MYDLFTEPTAERPSSLVAPPASVWTVPAASAGALARMLDIVDYGVLLVHESGHVVFANQVARGELDELHPLSLVAHQLLVRRPEDAGPLRAALTGACRKGLQKLLTLGVGDAAVTLSVVPICDATSNVSAGAMLLFGKRKGCQELSTEAFARHHKLTAAELRVLKQLCAGQRPSDIARAQGVALSTVRTQIGCAREKTGATSIGALVGQVSKLPPLQTALRP